MTFFFHTVFIISFVSESIFVMLEEEKYSETLFFHLRTTLDSTELWVQLSSISLSLTLKLL